MNPRQRWQVLQIELSRAVSYAAAGERDRALAAIDAALTLDPGFLAARTLRERILASTGESVRSRPPDAEPHVSNSMRPVEPRPLISPEGYARFEARARARRIQRRLITARQAIDQNHYIEARAALNEVLELDPGRPEVAELAAKLEPVAAVPALRPAPRTRRLGPGLAAAAAFGGVVLGVTFGPGVSDPSRVHEVRTVAKTAQPEAVATEPAVSRTIELPPPDVQPHQVEALNASLRLAEPPEAAGDAAVRSRLPETIAAAVMPGVPDTQLVRQVLERYRLAYEALDVRTMRRDGHERAPSPRSARLESQRITFSDCRVELQGKRADAMCTGTARFDMREPRVEPRTWNFTLRKVDSDWKILTARVSS